MLTQKLANLGCRTWI